MTGFEYFEETEDLQFNEFNLYLLFFAVSYRWRNNGEKIKNLDDGEVLSFLLDESRGLTKIRYAQIDPNGLCNAGCWFCPVAYEGNPKESINQMSPEDFRNIIQQIHENKGGIVSPEFNGIYSSHYNEALLYRYFEEMLETLREFKLGMIVLTNGTPLTPDKVDIINKYQDVVWGVCVNAPVWSDAELFAKRTNMKPNLFQKLKINVSYAYTNLKNKNLLSVQINGHDRESGAIKGPKFPDISDTELDEQVAVAKSMFPNANVF